jgi:hypothetical protein
MERYGGGSIMVSDYNPAWSATFEQGARACIPLSVPEIAGDPREACAGAAGATAPDGITGDAESEIAPRRAAGEEAAAMSSGGAVTLGEIAGRLPIRNCSPPSGTSVDKSR